MHEDKTNDQVARKPEVKGGTCKRSLGTMSNTASEFSLKGTLSYQYVYSGIWRDALKQTFVNKGGKLEQQELFKVDSTELFETLCRPMTLGQGFRMVSKNGGSAGIDGITIKDYKANLEQEIQNLSA